MMNLVRSQLSILLLAACIAAMATGVHARHLSQAIVVNGEGCGQVPPGPPVNLRATPGDGEVTLSWSAPANGACVDSYQVTARRAGTARSRPTSQTTKSFEVTIKELTNGQEYIFTVTAVSSVSDTDDRIASASVRAKPNGPSTNPPLHDDDPQGAPTQGCDPSLPPTKAINAKTRSLREVGSGLAYTEICWEFGDGDTSCVDRFLITTEALGVDDDGKPTTFNIIDSEWVRLPERCYVVKALKPSTYHRATIRATRPQNNQFSETQVTWTTSGGSPDCDPTKLAGPIKMSTLEAAYNSQTGQHSVFMCWNIEAGSGCVDEAKFSIYGPGPGNDELIATVTKKSDVKCASLPESGGLKPNTDYLAVIEPISYTASAAPGATAAALFKTKSS